MNTDSITDFALGLVVGAVLTATGGYCGFLLKRYHDETQHSSVEQCQHLQRAQEILEDDEDDY